MSVEPVRAEQGVKPAELLRASAGTGKTFTLSTRLIQLLLAGQSPERILATTFTRKAAGEIFDRLVHRLAVAADDPEACRELGGHVGDPELAPQRVVEVLARLLGSMHRLNICTLDSFAVRIAGAFAFELGLPPGWRIADETTEDRLRNDAVRETLDPSGEDPQRLIDLIRLLSPGEVRRSVHQHVLDTVSDLHELYRQQPNAEAWCWMKPPEPLDERTLTAAIEQLGHLQDHLPTTKQGQPSKTWVNAVQADQKRALSHEWAEFIAKGLATKIAADEETFNRKPIPDAVVEAYRPLIDHAKACLLRDNARATRGMYELLSRFDPLLEGARQRGGAYGFGDVKHRLMTGAVTGELEPLYYRLDGRIDHLLLDEFQDTSLAEWVLLQPIADELLSQQVEGRSFFCVGDLKQAIYGWRGGVAEIFDAIEDRWPQLKDNSRSENRTRRCSPAVVEAVNGVFQSLRVNEALAEYPAAAEQWAERFGEHEPIDPEKPGYVELRTSASVDGDRQKRVPLREVAERVRGLAGELPAGRSLGVLVRTNQAVARLIYELRRLGVPASEEGGNPLTDSPAVAVVLSALKLADHPGHTAAAYHVRRSPLGPILGLHSEAAGHRRRIASQIRHALVAEGYGSALFRWVEQLAEHCDQRDLNRLLQLVELAHQFEPDATLRPGDFVRFVERRRVADPASAAVRVMTVHQSKGLQFDAVVLPELTSGLKLDPRTPVLTDRPSPIEPPQRISRYADRNIRGLSPELERMHEQNQAAAIREALCVLYVAMTRAVHALHMIVPPSSDSESRLPANYAGLLRSALTDGAPVDLDQCLYQAGDPAWAQRIEPSAEQRTAPADATPPRPRLASGQQRQRGLTHRSPSALEGGERVDLRRVLRLETGGGREYGSAVHALFQEVEWLDDGPPDDATLRGALLEGTSDPETLIERFRAILDEPAIRDALRRSAYPEGAELRVLREHPFAVRIEGELLSGAFDRLVVRMENGRAVAADVIDFKTDRVDAEDGTAIDRLVAFYRPQVEAYRRAVCRLYGLEPEQVTAKLLFVSVGVARSL